MVERTVVYSVVVKGVLLALPKGSILVRKTVAHLALRLVLWKAASMVGITDGPKDEWMVTNLVGMLVSYWAAWTAETKATW